jgi:membrane protein DedA with SNARE-associated domain
LQADRKAGVICRYGPMFEHITHVAGPWLEHYGYAALFVAIFLEGIGIPGPGLTLLLASAWLASRGEMSMAAVAGAAFVGYGSASQLAFLIGRSGGRRLLLRVGLLNRHRLRTLHRLFARWGAPLLTVALFFDGTRQYAPLVAGTADMQWHRFTLFNLIGAAVWIGTWCTTIKMFGHDIEPVIRFVHGSAPWLLGAVATIVVVLLIRQFAHRRRRS